MHVTLNGNCEKIVYKQKNEKILIYNGEKVKIKNNDAFSISSDETQKSEILRCIYTFPLRLIWTLFDILFMNYEWDWIERFEPCAFVIDNYNCNSCENLEIEYNKSSYKNKKIILPQIIINKKKISKVKYRIYTVDLTVCLLKCCLKMIGILIWSMIPLTIIMINARKYSIYILLFNISIVFFLIIKMLVEYKKYSNVKRNFINVNNRGKKLFIWQKKINI